MPDDTLEYMNIIEHKSKFGPNANAYCKEHIDTLNEEQYEIFDSVARDIETKECGLHKVDAP